MICWSRSTSEFILSTPILKEGTARMSAGPLHHRPKRYCQDPETHELHAPIRPLRPQIIFCAPVYRNN